MKPEYAASLGPLALLAMREAGADGYALYSNRPDGSPVCLSICGSSVPDRDEDGQTVVSFPLQVEQRDVGQIAWVFASPLVPEHIRTRLEHMARTMGNVWGFSETSERLLVLTAHVSRLRGELADLKIADRARGFLDRPVPNATELMAAHVAMVAQAHRLETLLEEKAHEMEMQLRERRLISEAKSLLRNSQGLSEEQAYSHLRLTSRRSRQRLGEVARRFIESAQAGAQT
jgi:hypothetical protein